MERNITHHYQFQELNHNVFIYNLKTMKEG
jgi:hypothetical protein